MSERIKLRTNVTAISLLSSNDIGCEGVPPFQIPVSVECLHELGVWNPTVEKVRRSSVSAQNLNGMARKLAKLQRELDISVTIRDN